MRRLVPIFLQLYAVFLAVMQSGAGVRTDEAKYLLNIPYPHPPFVRFFLGISDGMPMHELFWRIVFATLVLQSVWLVWHLSAGRTREFRLAACGGWVLCSAVTLQAGTVMMAPLTAVQMLIMLVVVYGSHVKAQGVRGKEQGGKAMLIGLFWLISLFTAYQAVLFVPLVWAALRKHGASRFMSMLYVFLPISLLVLYTLTNPLALGALLIKQGQADGSILLKLRDLWDIWMLGGSYVLSIAGIIGIVRSRSWPLVLTFLLTSAYVGVSMFEYYAILFTPMFIAGLLFLPVLHIHVPRVFIGLKILISIFFVMQSLPIQIQTPSRLVARTLAARGIEGELLLQGSFGHDWQYESPVPVRRYAENLVPEAQAIVCIDVCDAVPEKRWVHLMGYGVQLFVR
jgi:hypothetical protein